jgi:hypothetical protein
MADRFTTKDGLPPGGFSRVYTSDGMIYTTAAKSGVAYRWDQAAAKWFAASSSKAPDDPGSPWRGLPGGEPSSFAKVRGGRIWAVTSRGAYVGANGTWAKLDLPRTYRFRDPAPHQDTEIRHISTDASGQVWLATSHGAYYTDGDQLWHPINRMDGMPYDNLNCLAHGSDGSVWGGTDQGAWRLKAGKWSYFWGRRWLPGNRVSEIALEKNGTAWVATDAGVSRISEKQMTLAEKAQHYEAITAARHNRRGWVTSCVLKVPGDASKGFLHEASDNDGLWTAIYVAAECYRYAATKSPEARQNAKKSLQAMLDLVRYSGVPNYPARALLKKGEEAVGYNAEETVRIPGETEKIWYTPKGYPDLLAKGDTSSDELDGHYLAWYLYAKLVATPEEKREIAEICRSVTDGMLKNDYLLIGHTGRRTLWGFFGPKYLNENPRHYEERSLNSLSILCYLKVTEYLTGDRKYQKYIDDLVTNHHYLQNGLLFRRDTPWYELNHSDDELAFCVYIPLLELETNPSRRAILLHGFERIMQGDRTTIGLIHEASPFYNYVYGGLTGQPCLPDAAAETLRTWPWELIDWVARNSQRHDLEMRSAPGTPRREANRILPAHERPIHRWNGNPFTVDGGDGGRTEECGSAWLLGYWAGRYYGYLKD